MRGRMKKLNKIFKALVFLMIISCSVNRQEVVGIYEVEYDFGKEKLVLLKSGKYIQFFATDNISFKEINSGLWYFNKDIKLVNPVIVENGFGDLSNLNRTEMDWFLPVSKNIYGGVTIIINSDLGLEFSKIDTTQVR